jgi:predicted nucleotidyltransferase
VYNEGRFVEEETDMDEKLKSSIARAAAELKAAGAKEVYVFGSAAYGPMREDSDIDLAVSGLPPAAFFRAMAKAGDVVDRPLDLVDLDDEGPFVEYLKGKGRLLRVA